MQSTGDDSGSESEIYGSIAFYNLANQVVGYGDDHLPNETVYPGDGRLVMEKSVQLLNQPASFRAVLY